MNDTNYLSDVELHSFVESMTLEECNLETLIMIDEEWNAINEAVGYNDISLFEAEILGLGEAEEAKGSFVDRLKALGQKIVAFLKKIASYIMGYISKWLATFEQIIKKEESKAKDRARVERGAKKLAEEDKKIEVYGLMVSNPSFAPAYLKLNNVIGSRFSISNSSMDQIAAAVDTLKLEANTFGDTARGLIIGKGPIPAGDFKAAITKEMTGVDAAQKYTFEAGNIVSAATSAVANVIAAKEQKAAAKKSYEDVKKAINEEIKNIAKMTADAKKYDKEQEDKKRAAYNGVKLTGDIYKIGANVMASANSIYLSVLSADYRLNAQLVSKCWAAGGSEASLKKDAKKAQKQAAEEYAKAGAAVDEAAEPTKGKGTAVTSESVESIFGLDLI